MRSRPAQVAEQLGVGAAGVLQGVGQNGQAGGVERPLGESAVVVRGPGEPGYSPVLPKGPVGVGGHAAEGERAENVPQQRGLGGVLGGKGRVGLCPGVIRGARAKDPVGGGVGRLVDKHRVALCDVYSRPVGGRHCAGE